MKTILFVLLVMSVSFSAALVVNHIPPVGFIPEQTTELRIELIQGATEVTEAVIMFRLQDSEVFDQVLMDKDALQETFFKGFLPVSAAPEKGYEYYFKLTTNTGAIETLPLIEPEKNPYVILPQTKAGDLTGDFILLSDEPVIYAKDGYIIAVSWFSMEDIIDLESVKLHVNGKNVTARAQIYRNMLIYKDTSPKPGISNAFVAAKTLDGKEIYSQTWTTVIKPSGNITNLPMNLRGSAEAGTNIYATANDNSANTFGSDRDDGWTSLNMYADYEKLRLKSYTYLSTLQNEDAQHLNKFRLGISLPFWDTYVGDYSPSLSSLTMSNKNLRGIYTKLHSKYFGLTVAHGEIVRSIEGKEYINEVTREVEYTPGTFKQEAFAARMELGSEDGFLMGITTTRNRDIISSLDSRYVLRTTEEDTTQIAFPKDNLVISMDSRMAIPQINFVLGVEGAVSLYNTNTLPGPFNSDDLAEYLDMDEGEEPPVNPADYQDIFIINTNIQPFPLSENFSDFASFVAWQAYLRNYFKSNLLNVSFSQIGASYKALSTNYMQNDAAQFMISDQFTYQQYLFVSGGYSQIKDNVSRTKLDINTYNNFFTQGLLRLPDLPYLLLAFTNSKGENELNNDIELSEPEMYNPYVRNSNMFSLGLGYEFYQIPVAPTTLDIGWRTGVNTEKRQLDSKALEKFYEFNTNNISFSLTSRFIEFPLKTKFGIAVNSQENTVNDLKNNYFNFLMRGDYNFPEYRISPWAEYKLTSLGGDQDKQAYNYITFGVNARPFANTNVSSSLGWQIYNNNDTQNADYTTTVWHLNLSQRF